jgi:acyl-CoA reductase-like NAD-dependent aldehyde dehydrogenase
VCGNTNLWKPAETTSLTAVACTKVWYHSHGCPNVCSILHCPRQSARGLALTC